MKRAALLLVLAACARPSRSAPLAGQSKLMAPVDVALRALSPTRLAASATVSRPLSGLRLVVIPPPGVALAGRAEVISPAAEPGRSYDLEVEVPAGAQGVFTASAVAQEGANRWAAQATLRLGPEPAPRADETKAGTTGDGRPVRERPLDAK